MSRESNNLHMENNILQTWEKALDVSSNPISLKALIKHLHESERAGKNNMEND